MTVGRPSRRVAGCEQFVNAPSFIRCIVSTSQRFGTARNRSFRSKNSQVYEAAINLFRRTAYATPLSAPPPSLSPLKMSGG